MPDGAADMKPQGDSHAVPPADPPVDPSRERTWRLLIAGVAFLLALTLFGKDRFWPPQYHTDEPSKAAQIATGEYNFYHPQLLLRGTQALALLRTGNPRGLEYESQPQEPQYHNIVYDGRLISAIFAAAAVGLLSFLAGMAQPGRPLISAAAAGACLPVLPLLVTHGHHMKEDTGLVLAIAASLVAGAFFLRRPSLRRAIYLGLVGGVALSTKWIGGLVTVGGLLLILRRGPTGEGSSWRQPALAVAAYLAGALAVFLLINLPMVWGLGRFLAGIKFEASHVALGHRGLVSPSPVWFYLRELVVEVGPVLLALAALRVVWLSIDRTQRTPSWWLAPATAGAFFVVICLPEYARDRYLLPVVVLTAWLGIQGAVMVADWLVRRLAKPASRWMISSLAVGVVAGTLLGVAMFRHAGAMPAHLSHFRHDTRDELRAWLAENLPVESKLLYEQWTGVRPWEVPFAADAVRELPDSGDIAAIQEAGYTHVAMSSMAFGRYFNANQVPTPEFAEEYERRKRMYEVLMEGSAGRVIFNRAPATTPPEMHSPEVYVVELSPPAR